MKPASYSHDGDKTIRNAIIFTDLDGTLIDRRTYSAALTIPLAQDLIDQGVPLVFCSSKTAGEQKALLQSMRIATPCIVENGSGIYLPEGSPLFANERALCLDEGDRMIELGVSSKYIQEIIQTVSRILNIDFQPYSRMTDEEVSAITGLDLPAARLAKNRDYSETLTATLSDDAWREAKLAFEEADLKCLCGGRFHTVTSKRCDKGQAINVAIQAYRDLSQEEWLSVGIGDSANDVDMLLETDQGYLVQQLDGTWSEMNVPGLHRIPAIGPEGWILAVTDALGLS